MRVAQLISPILVASAVAGAPAALAAGVPAAAAARRHPVRPPTWIWGRSRPPGSFGPQPIRSTPGHPIVLGSVARIIHGVAYAPSLAPIQVQRAIWAGNRIRHTPYIFGGGHGGFNAIGYDCSGSVSYVLHSAGLISTPMDSSEFMSWGWGGFGRWITVFSNPGHAFVEIAGIRFDTSAAADPNPAPGTGPRWRPLYRQPWGYLARHPRGL